MQVVALLNICTSNSCPASRAAWLTSWHWLIPQAGSFTRQHIYFFLGQSKVRGGFAQRHPLHRAQLREVAELLAELLQRHVAEARVTFRGIRGIATGTATTISLHKLVCL